MHHPQLAVILEGFRGYQAGETSLDLLQQTLAAALEGMSDDIPLPLRDRVRLAEAQLDVFRLSADPLMEAAEVAKIFRDVMAAIRKHDPSALR